MTAPSLLPSITVDDFDSKRDDVQVWMPVLRAIAERHGLEGPVALFPTGSAVVCSFGERWVIKLHEPWHRDLFLTEKVLLEYLEGRLPVATPELIASGEIEDWSYLVMRRLPGAPLNEVRNGLDAADLRRVAYDLGELVAATQALPVEGVDWPSTPWDEFITSQQSQCVARHRSQGVPETLLATLPEVLDGADVSTSQPVLLHTEWSDANVLVHRASGRWMLSGAFDFEPSMTGHPLYDLPALTILVARGETDIARAALAGYGVRDFDEELRRNLLAHTLLHRYSHLASFLSLVQKRDYSGGWPEIAAALTGLPDSLDPGPGQSA